MAVVTIAPPDLLVDLDLVKRHLRVDGDDEDTLIELYVAAACGHIDGVGGYLGRAIGEQTLEWRVADFWALPQPCSVTTPTPLPYGPATSIASITSRAANGEDQVLAADQYALIDGGLAFVGANLPEGEYVRVRYMAGGDPPKPIMAAVLLMTGDLYARRESSSQGEVYVSPTVENLLRPFRVLEV